ncbi:MAG: PSD1 and planctomycete cytochrome C domain-containing protein [Armatimonadota bacterium]
MRHPFRNTLIGTLVLSGAAVLATLAVASEPPPAATLKPPTEAAADPARFFETRIRPVLATRCQSCHGGERQSGGLRVDSREALLKGGASGPALIPGKPEQSLLWQALTYGHALKMPPGGKLPDRQVADLSRWIAAGAAWPAGTASGGRADASHWAFQPVRRPPLPRVNDRAWVKSPIDAFVLAGLEQAGLRPAPPADRRTLIRRATFDLTGLPPTPGEIEAFLADRSPDAWEKVVDRLLASPAYGERWGRHWLDVARYADSNGLDENVAHGNAWRYRDWVIRSFNEDKPYDQFLTEQLAGDLLPAEDTPTRHARLIATGFLSLGPKVLAEADKEKMLIDIVDEQLDTTGKAFMGLTLGCARCHDHKFDPISTEDYYALAGIFKSTKSMESLVTIAKWWENPIPTPEDLARKAEHEKRVAAIRAEIDALLARGKEELTASGSPLPKEPESAYRPELREQLKTVRERLAAAEKEAPELPTAMGVTEGDPVDVQVHLRGDHLTLGKVVPRRFPVVLAGASQPKLQSRESGRLQLARWLASPTHPLTSRVMVNRVWRWHFGRGLVATTDNFGFLGEKPSHPELLDYLASVFSSPATVRPVSTERQRDGETKGVRTVAFRGASAPADRKGSEFIAHPSSLIPREGLGWSVKRLHRLLMLSSTYQMASQPAKPRAGGAKSRQPETADPENRLLWRMPVRRLEAEEVRDALLAVSGTLDRTMGGSLLHVKNREFFFDHTSIDGTRYDSKKRAVYLPVVRNHVYDVFQLFDFVDPAVLESNRATTTIAPQALFWLNSDLVMDASRALADRLLAQTELDQPGRVRSLFVLLYGRPATTSEVARGLTALAHFQDAAPGPDAAARRAQAWAWYCHALLAANEFLYLR